MGKKILAVDLGITSFGYAVLKKTEVENRYNCLDNSVVMRDSPYSERGESSQHERSSQRSLRRLIEKRKKRIRCVAKKLEDFGLLSYPDAMAINDPDNNPIKNRWELRAVEAWKRPLTAEELFAVFAHMAKHRGYKSIATDDLLHELELELGLVEKNVNEEKKADEKHQIYAALGRLEQLKEAYKSETIAQVIHRAVQEGKFRSYRNHDDYEKMIRREDIEEEIEKIIAIQRDLGGLSLSDEKAGEFIDDLQSCITDQEMPTIDPNLFGKCTFYQYRFNGRFIVCYPIFRSFN